MSTRIEGAEAVIAPRAINVRLAAAIGLVLLAVGLAVGLIVGGLLAGSDQQTASASVTSVAASPAKVPTLSWKDDYGTRHHLIPVNDPVLGWHDFLGTRDHPTPTKAPALSWKDDYGTRHPNERP
jgi:hypothetical protein